MKTLVLGASGFLGRKVLNKLDVEESDLFAGVRSLPGTQIANCKYLLVDDLIGTDKWTSLKFDIIINVAMKRSSRNSPISDEVIEQLNFKTPLEVMEKYSHAGTLILNTSTYIQNFQGIKGNTVEPYGASKEKLSRALEIEAGRGNFNVLDLYLFTLFGPGDRQNHLVPLLISALRSKAPVELSEGDQLINLLYIDDAVESIVRATKSELDGYSASFLWEEEYYSVKELVSRLEQVAGTKLNITWGAVPYGGHEMFVPWNIPVPQYKGLVANTSLVKGLELTFNTDVM